MAVPGALVSEPRCPRCGRSAEASFEEEHLKKLGLLDAGLRPQARVVAITNRNLGNNYGFMAWHRQWPRPFFLRGEPADRRSYAIVCWSREKALTIRRVTFAEERVRSSDGSDLTDEMHWCASGQQILRDGEIVPVEELFADFYDARHVLALDPLRPDGQRGLEEVYGRTGAFDFEGFAGRVREKWQAGFPRSRYFHNCLGLSRNSVLILQKEGTPEELARELQRLGAQDALILDNGGSVGCWAWWVYPSGGFIFTAPGYRPKASAVIAIVLKGPAATSPLPGTAPATMV
ncbi:MAG: hypothetical protein ACUVTQ_11005 [Desulfotomaculales bacterium]